MTGAILERLITLLEREGADFQVLHHEPARTSEEAARVRGTPLEQGAKALVFLADGTGVLLVAQAHRRVDTKAFKREHNVRDLRLMSPDDLFERFSLEVGAVPPFGSLLGLQTYVDERLLQLPRIVFNAGSRATSVLLKTADYQRIEQPLVRLLASGAPPPVVPAQTSSGDPA